MCFPRLRSILFLEGEEKSPGRDWSRAPPSGSEDGASVTGLRDVSSRTLKEEEQRGPVEKRTEVGIGGRETIFPELKSGHGVLAVSFSLLRPFHYVR